MSEIRSTFYSTRIITEFPKLAGVLAVIVCIPLERLQLVL